MNKTLNTDNTHNTHSTHNTHPKHSITNVNDVSFTPKKEKAKSIRLSSRFNASATMGFQSTELYTTPYIRNQLNIVNAGLTLMSDLAMNWISATEDVQLLIIAANL
jgi:hypothetical protein